MNSPKIPQYAAKDHNFVFFNYVYEGKIFVCNKCNTHLCLPISESFWNYPYLDSFWSYLYSTDVVKQLKQLGCYYYITDHNWNTALDISFLSCDEFLIRDIIL